MDAVQQQVALVRRPTMSWGVLTPLVAMWRVITPIIKTPAGMVLYLAAHLVIWYGVVQAIPYATFVLPYPHTVVGSLFENDTILKIPNILWIGQQLLYTLRDAGLGFLVGNVLAVILSIVVLFFPQTRGVIMRDSIAIRSVPWIMLVPILLMIFGTGWITVIILVCTSIFFYPFVSFYTGLLKVDQDVLDYTQTLPGVTDWVIFSKVRLFYALPYLFAALKVSASGVILASVVIEWLLGREGLGYLLYTFNYRYRMDLLVALCFVTGFASYGCMRVVSWLEGKFGDESVSGGNVNEQRI